MTSTTAGRRRTPVWKEVEEQESRKLRNRARAAATPRRRVAVVYDIEGPRVRLGILWFVVAAVALVLGVAYVAVVYGVTAAVAGAQAARAWRRSTRRKHAADEQLAAVIGLGLPLAALVSTPVLGIAVLVAVGAVLVRHGFPGGVRTLQCGLWPGAAAAAVVVSHRFEPWSAAALVLTVSAYEIGDYLVGSGARNSLEGPIAGALAAIVVQFGIAAIGLPPFELPSGFGFALLAGALCPVGQLVASLVLPNAGAKAPALRRLDSLLVLGPVWAFLAGLAAQSAV